MPSRNRREEGDPRRGEHAFVDDETQISSGRLREELAAQTKRALVHPVFSGSAKTGAGVDSLMAGIAELLPARDGDAEGRLSGTVFKVDRGRSREKIAYVRMFSGTLVTRDRVREQKVTAISVFEDGEAVRRQSVGAGQIAQLWGLADVQIGDTIGDRTDRRGHHFAPPTLESVVVPRRPGEKGALHVALAQLAEQDPLINLRQDDVRGELFISLYGEVQKEVIEATLASDFYLEVDFRETTTICVERPAATGEAVERLRVEPNPFLATVGLRVEPAPPGSGTEFRREVEVHRTMPAAFFRAVEDTDHETLHARVAERRASVDAVSSPRAGLSAAPRRRRRSGSRAARRRAPTLQSGRRTPSTASAIVAAVHSEK